MAGRRPWVWGRRMGVAAVLLGTAFLSLAGGRRFRAWLLGASARSLLRLLRVEVTVAGPLPRPPFLLVANHLSYLDVLVLASRLPARFVAKAEVRGWPLLGPICNRLGTIFIDRGDRRDIPRALAGIERALARGEGVILFPEGTSSSGEAVGPFRSPLLALPARRRLPVHAAALGYRAMAGDPPARLAVCWWGETELLPHLLGLFHLRKIEATLAFAAAPVVETDRKLLADRLRNVVEERYAPEAERALRAGPSPAASGPSLSL